MLFRRRRGPSPCPGCDYEFPEGSQDAAVPDRCPQCGTELVSVRVASFWRRSAALGIDLGVLAVTALPLHLLLRRVVGGPGLAPESEGIDAMLQVAFADIGPVIMSVVPLILMSALYFALFWILRGQTLGQRVLGVRIIDQNGGQPTPVRCVVRILANVAGLAPAALGPLWMALDMERRAFHDHVAGTYVIAEAKA